MLYNEKIWGGEGSLIYAVFIWELLQITNDFYPFQKHSSRIFLIYDSCVFKAVDHLTNTISSGSDLLPGLFPFGCKKNY